MMRSITRYDCADGAGPISTDSSASRTNAAERSASLCTATVRIPRSRQPRMIRRAISPRLATSTFSNIVRTSVRSGADLDERLTRADDGALGRIHLGDRARTRCGDVVLHLHRLEHAYDVAERHPVSHLDVDLEQQPLHRRQHGSLAHDRSRALHGCGRRTDPPGIEATDDSHRITLPIDLDGELAYGCRRRLVGRRLGGRRLRLRLLG